MEKEHGFTTQEEWSHFFDKYFENIHNIEKLSHFANQIFQNGEDWLKAYEQQSVLTYQMNQNNDEYLQKHIYYFINEPNQLTHDVADALLRYLFRKFTSFDNIAVAYRLTNILYQFYEERHNEIALMKCDLIYMASYTFLDFPHHKKTIYEYCQHGIAIYEKYYDQLDEQEKSLGLSLFDFEIFSLLEYEEYEPCLSLDETIVKFQRSIRYIDQFMKTADFTKDYNQIIPYMRTAWLISFTRVPIKKKIKHLDTAKYTIFTSVLQEISTILEDQSQYAKYKYEILVHMLDYLGDKESLDVISQFIMEFIDHAYKSVHEEIGGFNDEEIDVYQLLAMCLNILAEDNPHLIPYVQKLIEIMSAKFSKMGHSNYLEYMISTSVFQFIIPILHFLEYEDALHILLNLTTYRQPQTAVHSIMVSQISILILDDLITYKPELFIGQLGCQSKEEVIKSRQDFLNYIQIASQLHDVGKILCTNVINMQYRKLINIEFQTIQFHPQISDEIIQQIPPLQDFRDIAVGHHRSYDGKSGYPKYFDNTKSPYKIFIDLISICDTLDAATDNIGRSYTKTKSLNHILEELHLQFQNVYNQEIIEHILSSEYLRYQLHNHLVKGREDCYIEIFNKVLQAQNHSLSFLTKSKEVSLSK